MPKGDVRITLSVRIVGVKEPLVAMDSESDQAGASLRIARICLDNAERKLAERLPLADTRARSENDT